MNEGPISDGARSQKYTLVFVKRCTIARLCHIGIGFLKFSLMLLNPERMIYGKVM